MHIIGNPSGLKAVPSNIDKEIASFEGTQPMNSSVHILRTYHSILSPISRLPPEILSRIFHLAADGDTCMKWVAVTHVCQYWRNVALEAPQLWANINFTKPKWATEMLTRSRTVPLSVHYYYPKFKPEYPTAVDQAFLQMTRMRKIDIHANGTLLNRMLSMLCVPAPQLRALFLWATGSGKWVLPPSIFDGHCPVLNSIKLTSFTVNWSLPIFSSVTDLDITNNWEDDGPTLKILLTALERMVYLKSLRISIGINWSSPESDLSHNKAIHLPHLRRISVESYARAWHVFKFITGPKLLFIRFSGYGDDMSMAQLSGLQLVGSRLSDVIPPLRRLNLIHKGYCLQLRSWHTLSNNQDNQPSIDTMISWNSDSDPGPTLTDLKRLTVRLCTPLHFRNVQHLTLITGYRLLDTHWLQLFKGLPQLHSICSNRPVGLVTVLNDFEDTRNTRFLLPRLQTLTVVGWNFDRGSFIDVLINFLDRRQSWRFEIKQLKLLGCQIEKHRNSALGRYTEVLQDASVEYKIVDSWDPEIEVDTDGYSDYNESSDYDSSLEDEDSGTESDEDI